MLEAKLGIDKKGKSSYSKFAKKMGFDEDLFDFLSDINHKVKGKPK